MCTVNNPEVSHTSVKEWAPLNEATAGGRTRCESPETKEQNGRKGSVDYRRKLARQCAQERRETTSNSRPHTGDLEKSAKDSGRVRRNPGGRERFVTSESA